MNVQREIAALRAEEDDKDAANRLGDFFAYRLMAAEGLDNELRRNLIADAQVRFGRRLRRDEIVRILDHLLIQEMRHRFRAQEHQHVPARTRAA